MYYQLSTGKVIQISLDQFLELTDLDVQYLLSIDYGEHVIDPFQGSAVETTAKREYDFSFISYDDEPSINDIPSDELSYDDIIDLSEDTDL